MTQAAVSYQIKILEERVGASLFERLPRGVKLSGIGRHLAAKTSDALNILSEAFSEAQENTQKKLSISTIPTFATNFLAQRIRGFQTRNPSIVVQVEINDTLVDLSSEGFDVAITSGHGRWPGLKSHLLISTNFTPMLSPELAKSIGGVKVPSDLLKLPLIADADPRWKHWFEAAGIPGVNYSNRERTQIVPQVLEANAAIAGQGVGILTPAFYKDAVDQKRLIQPFDLLCDDGSGYWLVYPESHRNSTKIRKFRNWLDQELAEFKG